MKNGFKPYVVSVAIALGVGGLSAFVTRGGMDIYNDIVMPPLSPPSWLFPVVWSVLYVLMGISAAMVYTARDKDKDRRMTALKVYGASLCVNFLWSIVFFNMRLFLTAFAVLLLLLFLIIKTISLYKPISVTASRLQIPYAVWVAFAGYLNIAIWLLNK